MEASRCEKEYCSILKLQSAEVDRYFPWSRESWRGRLEGTLPCNHRAQLLHLAWQRRGYGKLFSTQLITATMMIHRKTLTKKVIIAEVVKCAFELMLAPRARETHREAESRG